MKQFLKDFFSTLGIMAILINLNSISNPMGGIQNIIDQQLPVQKLTKIDQTHFQYSFNEEIREHNYDDLIMFLKTAKPGDQLLLEINSPGGLVSTTLDIIEAMQTTNASVSCKAGEWVASGAAIVLLQCGKIELQPNTKILFHLPFMPFNGQAIHDANTSSFYINYVDQNFCLRQSMGAGLFEKMMLGYNIVYKPDSFEPIMTNGCRIVHGNFMVVGHH